MVKALTTVGPRRYYQCKKKGLGLDEKKEIIIIIYITVCF
jgi:hypothetical protein